jgi:hypothetical protein
VGIGVAAGLGVAGGFFAAVAAFGFGASFDVSFFLAAGALAGGCAAGGVSEICADTVVAAIAIARPATIDMGRGRFMSGVIPVRSFLFQFFQALRHAPV